MENVVGNKYCCSDQHCIYNHIKKGDIYIFLPEGASIVLEVNLSLALSNTFCAGNFLSSSNI